MMLPVVSAREKKLIVYIVILLKNPLGFFSFFRVGPLTDEPEFVTSIHFPLHHFTGVDINGSRQRQRQVHITLRDGLFASDGLDFSGVVHGFSSLVNKIDVDNSSLLLLCFGP